jgi:hypothetical protein
VGSQEHKNASLDKAFLFSVVSGLGWRYGGWLILLI